MRRRRQHILREDDDDKALPLRLREKSRKYAERALINMGLLPQKKLTPVTSTPCPHCHEVLPSKKQARRHRKECFARLATIPKRQCSEAELRERELIRRLQTDPVLVQKLMRSTQMLRSGVDPQRPEYGKAVSGSLAAAEMQRAAERLDGLLQKSKSED